MPSIDGIQVCAGSRVICTWNDSTGIAPVMFFCGVGGIVVLDMAYSEFCHSAQEDIQIETLSFS